ncbi:Dimeric alpha+beta barrel [Glarea lozoyensis ATCC 20868]|uniref:Dimeric alpha+beta barrel n=1 Tax=Glarea lozoyensis (strain ATCC 20868 / MF5171) TaxID=1116229 RepID=S3DGN1_GLAL2|nr:Dimeric alpha+beta barrel [Glarea lozoyensis ATCC 20868]EPE36835.1 Dimeric alpha+beta barrel [Glarea lozoyensis ATCC 20868]
MAAPTLTRALQLPLPLRLPIPGAQLSYSSSIKAFRAPRFQQVRKMASANPITVPEGKFEWLVILPDGEGKFAKRMEVRPKHFEGLTKNVDNGFYKMGGAILDEVPKEGEAMGIVGSALVCVAASKEEIFEVLKNDIYAKNEVWDFSKVQVYPFKCAFRMP